MVAFRKSFLLSTCSLALMLGVTGIGREHVIGVAPWDTYRDAMTMRQNFFSEDRAEKGLSEESRQQLSAMFARFDTMPWKVIYSVTSLVLLALLNSALCFSSLAFSRMILREIIAASSVFATISLLITNFALVVPLWTLVFMSVIVLFQPLFWILIPLLYLAAQSSVYWVFAIFGAGGLLAWKFGSVPLKVITMVGFLPCILAVIITVFSALVLYQRERFHRIVSALFLRCVERGPLKVAVAVLLVLAAIIASLIPILRL